jgi:hypothetical protein
LESLKGKDHAEYMGEDGKLKENSMSEKECMDWTGPTQDEKWCRAVVSTVMNIRILQTAGDLTC